MKDPTVHLYRATSLPSLRNLANRINTLSKDLPRVFPDPRLKGLEQDSQEIIDLANDLEHVGTEGSLPVKTMNLIEFTENTLKELMETSEATEFQEVEFLQDLKASKLSVAFSPVALEQALETLFLLSAREAGAGAQVVVQSDFVYLDQPLSSTEVIPAGEYGVIHIIDDGDGIPEKELDTFYEGRDKKYPDIDLTLAESMIRHMGGILNVDSTVGEGTKLSIYLPIFRDMEDPGSPATSGGTVLVVEDHKPMKRLLQATLHRSGFEVLFAETGAEAISTMKKAEVDVILLDLVLSNDTQARDFTFREIHAAYPETSILCTGGVVEPQVLADVIQAGSHGFVEKPFDLDKVIQLVKRRRKISC